MKAVFLVMLLASSAFAEQRKALIYDIGKTKEAVRFNQETIIEEPTPGEKSWTSKIMSPDGQVVMTEIATMKNDRVSYQYVEQLQLKEAYELTIEGDKATYRTFDIVDGKKAKTKNTSTIKISDNFVTGPMTEFYLQKRWADLMEGKVIKAEFGIFELQKSLSFEYKKLKETEKSVEVEMRPGNFLIAMFVGPMVLEFDKEKKRIIRFVGRTPLREKVKGQWKALDAEILYP